MEGHRARRRFSQNFLHDVGVIARIVAAIDPRPGQHLVEIGPGLGSLTALLIERAGRITAVEIDRDLAERLRGRFAAGGLDLVVADALQLDWPHLARSLGGALRIVGNLPYHVSTPLLFCLLPIADQVQDQHFMLQREVVDRIVAAPGTPAYGRLTVMLAPRVTASRVLDVGPGAFRPAPKVASSVVRLVVLDALPDWARSPLYGEVVTAAFGQRRKTLRNALRRYLSAPQIGALGIDPGLRAETLTPMQFGALAQAAAAMLH